MTGARVVALLAFLAWVAPGTADVAPPGYISETLPNGLKVSILPDPSSPVVATQLWYHVGAANEDEDSRGLAHLFEHLMFGATSRHGKRDYWDLHQAHGGENNAYTSADETTYESEIPPGPQHLRVLEMEADRMVNLVLDQEQLDNEKKIVTEELRLRTENDPMSRLFVAAQRALLGEHPYAMDPSGTKEDVAAATLETCRSFYERHYRPGGAHLVVVGAVDAPATLGEVRRIFGALPPGGAAAPDVPSVLGWTFPEELVLREDLPPVEIAIQGFPLPPAESEDYWPLVLLGQLLGGGAVDLFEEDVVQRERKALLAGTELLFLRRGGAVVFYSAALPYRRKSTAFKIMDRALERLSQLDWLTDERLAAAKRSLRREEAGAAYYVAQRAHQIGQAEWWQGDDRLAFAHDERLASITRQQVADVYQRYMGDPRPVRLYLEPEHVPLVVRLFGWVYPLVNR